MQGKIQQLNGKMLLLAKELDWAAQRPLTLAGRWPLLPALRVMGPVQAAQASESALDLSFPSPGSDSKSIKVQGWWWGGSLLTGFYPKLASSLVLCTSQPPPCWVTAAPAPVAFSPWGWRGLSWLTAAEPQPGPPSPLLASGQTWEYGQQWGLRWSRDRPEL